jgi:hypothetical protein
MRDLKVEHDRAVALLAALEARGAVGPTFITGTGARESRVNLVQAEAPRRPDSLFVGLDRRLGMRTVCQAVACALVGLLLELGMFWLGLGAALSRWLSAEVGSPIAAAMITNVVPLAGLGTAWLLELPLRPAEDLVPYLHLRIRSGIWTCAGLLGVGYVILRLLS